MKSTPLETYDAKMIRRKEDEGQETYLGGGGFQEWPDDTRFRERSVGGVAPSKAAPTTHRHISQHRRTAHTKSSAIENQQGEAGEQRAGRNGFHHPNLSIKAQERAGKKTWQLTTFGRHRPRWRNETRLGR